MRTILTTVCLCGFLYGAGSVWADGEGDRVIIKTASVIDTIFAPGDTIVYGIGGIADMIAAAQNGDTVYVPEGVYEQGQLNIDKSITLAAVGNAENTIISLTGGDMSVLADMVTVKGFTITGSESVYLVKVGRSTQSVSGCRIENCVFAPSGDADGITIYSNAADIDIISCDISNCVNGVVIYPDCADIAVLDNDIHDNGCGIRLLGSVAQTRLYANGIYRNTLYGVFNGSAVLLNAANNFWAVASGPFHTVLNPAGKGNTVSDYIEFMPYFTGIATGRWQVCPQGDLNGDCIVNLSDFAVFGRGWADNVQ